MKNSILLPITLLAWILSAMLTTSCDSKISREQIVGKWALESLESEINGVPDATGKLDDFEGYVYCEFNANSTYVLNDGEVTERGTWVLRDSLLGMLLEGQEDDSTNYTWYVVEEITDSSLTKKSSINSDCGIITEISNYRKVEN